ncbi:MAG: hypothetical protein MJK13_16520 [Pseudomonadales bacterium]|nr:hypothetical protein [Pseudomonadales bacterium]
MSDLSLFKLGEALEVLDENSSIEELQEAVAVSDGIIAKVKDLLDTLKTERDEQLLRIVDARGPFQIGDTKYYRGVDKNQRHSSPVEILNALSEATEGDFYAICGCLSSNAWKAGACKEILGKESPLFWYEESDKLKESKLMKVNTIFVED